MEEIEKTTISIEEKSLDLLNPDQTVVLEDQGLDIADLVYQPTAKNPRSFFFNPASAGDPEGPHQFISCHRNLVRIYSISARDGIQLQTQHPVPDFPESDQSQRTNNLVREFRNRPKIKKVSIITKTTTEDLSTHNLDFREINLRKNPKDALCTLHSLFLEFKESYRSTKKILLNTADSHRIYIQNSLLEVNHQSITQSYLSPFLKHPTPAILFQKDHEHFKKIYDQELEKLKLGYSLFDQYQYLMRPGYHYFNWTTLENHNFQAVTKDVSDRLYYIRFDLFKVFSVVKFYDKLSRRLLKEIRFFPGKILFEGLVQHDLIKNKVSNTKLTDYDLLQDELVITGEIYMKRPGSEVKSYLKFKFTAKNCLLKKKDQIYEFDIKEEPDDLEVKKSCFGDFNYFLDQGEENDNSLIINFYKEGVSKDLAKSLVLDKTHPLLDRMMEIQELGVMEHQNLIYIRDRRFLYLIDIRTAVVKQRVRYTALDTLVEAIDTPKPATSLLCKLDSENLLLEIFRVKGGSIKDLKDINLKEVLHKDLSKNDLKIENLELTRMAESEQNNEVSFLSYFTVWWSSYCQEYGKEFISLITLDRSTLELKSSYIISRVKLSDCYAEKNSFKKWRYNQKEGYWHRLFYRYSKHKIRYFRIGPAFQEKMKSKTIQMEGDLDQFPENEELRKTFMFNERIYIESKTKYSYNNISQLSVFIKSEDPEEEGGYKKLRSVDVGTDKYRFIDENAELKVLDYKLLGKDHEPLISIINSDLVVTHRLKLDKLCGELEPKNAVVTTVPSLLGGSKVLLRLNNKNRYYNHPRFTFLLDLDDLTLIQFRKGNHGEEGRTLGEELQAIENHSRETFNLRFWDSQFLMLDSFVYSFGD